MIVALSKHEATVQVKRGNKTPSICKKQSISTEKFTFIPFIAPFTFLAADINEVGCATETEDQSLNGQLVLPLPFPNCKYGLWMVTVLNKAEWRPRRRAPPQVSPGTFLSSCHWIRACLSGGATGGPATLTCQSSIVAGGPARCRTEHGRCFSNSPTHPPTAFFPPLCSFSSNYHVSFSRLSIGGDVVLVNAKKRRRRDGAASPLRLAAPLGSLKNLWIEQTWAATKLNI